MKKKNKETFFSQGNLRKYKDMKNSNIRKLGKGQNEDFTQLSKINIA